MGKKCIPGFYCVENMTLFLFFVLLLLIFLFGFQLFRLHNNANTNANANANTNANNSTTNNTSKYIVYNSNPILGIETQPQNNDPLSNPYVPPLRNNNVRSSETNYKQIGILTRNNEILPLMGKRKMTSRYKWQYYTIIGGGNGNLQTKLPVSVNGKSCTGEYGCDEIYNNDTVYVEGYKDIFVATIYENNTYDYIP